MNKSQIYGSYVILDKYFLAREPDYAEFMEERLWDNFRDLIVKELKEKDSIIVEKVFDMQEDLFETNQLKVRQDISVTKLIHCKDCKFWNRYDDVQVIGSCNRYGDIYNKRETDFCSWAEQKDEVEK